VTITKGNRRRGAKCKLTSELANTLFSLLENAISVEIVCQAVGIGVTTYYDWHRRGKGAPENSLYSIFRRGVTCARARAEVKLLTIIHQAALTDPKASMWLLERLYPERYARKIWIRRSGAAETPKTIHANLASVIAGRSR